MSTLVEINDKIERFVQSRDSNNRYRNKEAIFYRIREIIWQVEKLPSDPHTDAVLVQLNAAKKHFGEFIFKGKDY